MAVPGLPDAKIPAKSHKGGAQTDLLRQGRVRRGAG
jgi:hypothetical protein